MTQWCIMDPEDVTCSEYCDVFSCHREGCGPNCCCKAEQNHESEIERLRGIAKTAAAKLTDEEKAALMVIWGEGLE